MQAHLNIDSKIINTSDVLTQITRRSQESILFWFKNGQAYAKILALIEDLGSQNTSQEGRFFQPNALDQNIKVLRVNTVPQGRKILELLVSDHLLRNNSNLIEKYEATMNHSKSQYRECGLSFNDDEICCYYISRGDLREYIPLDPNNPLKLTPKPRSSNQIINPEPAIPETGFDAPTLVKLTGATSATIVTVLENLKALQHSHYLAFFELVQMCRNPDYIIQRNPAGEDTYSILQANALINADNSVHTDIKNIVKYTVIGEGFNMKIV